MNSFYDFDYDKEKENIDLDLQAKSQALENLIQKQNEEDQKIKDEYDSMGSRATRFLEALGAGLRGENASNVVRSQRQDLSNQLTNNLNRFKNERDAAYGQYKDLLARRENLNNTAYNRNRDQVKDEQFNKNYELDKTKADRDYEIRKKTLELSTMGQNSKNEQNQKDLEIAEKEKNDRRNNILKTLTTIQQEQKNIIDPDSGTWYSPYTDSEKKSASLVNKLNIDTAMDTFGLSEKEATDFIAKNPEMFGKKSDSWDVLLKKYSNINKEYQPVEEKQIDGKDILEVREKIDNNGNPVKIYKLKDDKGNISYHIKQ